MKTENIPFSEKPNMADCLGRKEKTEKERYRAYWIGVIPHDPRIFLKGLTSISALKGWKG